MGVLEHSCLPCYTSNREKQTYKGVFTPALFSLVELNPGAFTPLVRFVWAGVNTVITLGWGPKQPCWRGGLCPVTNEFWYASFEVWTWSKLDLTQLHQLRCALYLYAQYVLPSLSLCVTCFAQNDSVTMTLPKLVTILNLTSWLVKSKCLSLL